MYYYFKSIRTKTIIYLTTFYIGFLNYYLIGNNYLILPNTVLVYIGRYISSTYISYLFVNYQASSTYIRSLYNKNTLIILIIFIIVR